SKLLPWLCYLVELVVWTLLIIGTMICFDLQVDSAKNAISSRTAFTYHQFNQFLKTVTFPFIWIGVLSLTWELVTSMFRCACVSGFLKRFLGMIQWTVFAAAAVSMFAVSLVPFSFVEYDSHARLWPGVRQAFGLVDRYQLANSYGLFRRMTGVGGRPEVVIEGSKDGNTWTEIEFMYKPGNLSASPPVVTPHQPRLDWQMWFAALGPQTQSPWFTSLMYRLLQGKREVIELIQTDVSKYPFHEEPPAYLRAHRYRYWFTEPKADGSYPERWWRRVYDEEFYPRVHLGNTFLDGMLSQFGLKDKSAPRRVSNTTVAQAVRWVRTQVRGVPAHTLIWSLIACCATFCLLPGLRSKNKHAEQTAVTHKMAEKVNDHTEGVDEDLSDPEEKQEQQAKEEEDDEKNTEDEEEDDEENEQEVINENDDEEEILDKGF
ncbi:hypothetical protein CHARACLAT_025286, partial [Characodon lateralis]|nr:hypothetical protein [Characodon lateralis]